MSRIGKRPIPIPQGVDVQVGAGSVTVKGPRGTLTRPVHPDMILRQDDGVLLVERPSDDKEHRSLHGLTRTLVANMVEGVTNGYARALDIVGVGYRSGMAGKNLTLAVGFSHGIEIPPMPGIEFEAGTDPQTRTPFVLVKGIDKQLVGHVAAQIRSIRKPEPYKGKGIRYRGEQIRRKAGKSGKAGAKGAKK
ncbi:MAG: 50S ribosomal protein L6 [Chthonomonadales bacterium]|nr:50S ribosomal protein L6 [Chthonomonadales bacterium]